MKLGRCQPTTNVDEGVMRRSDHDQIAMRKRLVQRVGHEPGWYP